MKAFFIANMIVKNPEKFQTYVAKAGESMQPYGGKPITKGKVSACLAGEVDHDMVSIVSFPDQVSLDEWFDSETYQSLIPLRDEAVDLILTSYNVPS